jgi:hypothetical protein
MKASPLLAREALKKLTQARYVEQALKVKGWQLDVEFHFLFMCAHVSRIHM